jgi:hypothetical protein
VRATDRLTRAAADHKRRIRDLARQLLPMSPLTGDLGAAGLAVLERYADPDVLARAGLPRLTALIATASHGHQGAGRASQWLEAAQASLALYAGHPAVDFAGLAAEVATEIGLLRATCAELAAHAAQREQRYRAVEPAGLARSLPGLAQVGGPALAACMGDPARFGHGKQFRSFTGPTPRASETDETDRKDQPMSKAGSSLLRTTLVRAADTARKQDPQLARIYHQQMTSAAKTTPARSAWSPPPSPSGPGPSCAAALPTSSATPTASPSPPSRPKRSSPGTRPCPPKSAPGGAARRRGRPPESPRRTVRTGQPPPRHHSTPPRPARQADHLTTESPIGNQK